MISTHAEVKRGVVKWNMNGNENKKWIELENQKWRKVALKAQM